MNSGDILDDYSYDTRLGQGGMAEVWRATHIETGEQVAIKILLPEHTANPRIRVRFEREGHIDLDQPNIVRVLRLIEVEGRPALVMPFFAGGSLEDRIRHTPEQQQSGIGSPLPLADVFSISAEILGALDFAHQKEIIHRDVKPANMLLDVKNRAYLSDFGIALDMKRISVTQAGGDLGTPLYMSPEQIRRPSEVRHLTDVYSFGCCLFDMLAGRPPFISDETDNESWSFSIKMMHVKDPPPSLRSFNPEVTVYLDQLVRASLEKDPAKRLPGCGEFLRQLGIAKKRFDLGNQAVSPKPHKFMRAAAATVLVAAGYGMYSRCSAPNLSDRTQAKVEQHDKKPPAVALNPGPETKQVEAPPAQVTLPATSAPPDATPGAQPGATPATTPVTTAGEAKKTAGNGVPKSGKVTGSSRTTPARTKTAQENPATAWNATPLPSGRSSTLNSVVPGPVTVGDPGEVGAALAQMHKVRLWVIDEVSRPISATLVFGSQTIPVPDSGKELQFAVGREYPMRFSSPGYRTVPITLTIRPDMTEYTVRLPRSLD